MARWAICPQPLFIPPLRDILLDKTGRLNVRRVAEPQCGTMEIDVDGTAQGMWVLDGHDVTLTAENFDKFFALAPDDIQPEKYHILVTAHPSFKLPNDQYHIYRFPLEESGRVNRRFSELEGDGTVHCYIPEFYQEISFFMAYGADNKVSIERINHATGDSPCHSLSADSWELSGEEIILMR